MIEDLPYIKRGAKEDWHVGNVSGDRTRSLNWVEAQPHLREIGDRMHLAIGDVKKKFSVEVLEFYRELLKPYNLSNHVVRIRSAMGSGHIEVNGLMLEHYRWHRSVPVIQLLEEIEQSLDWDYAAWLHDEKLT